MKRNPFEEMREKMLQSASEGIRQAYSSEEYALIQAINAYLETSKSYNLAYERLTEWYGIYYPEIRINNPKTLAELTIEMNEGDATLEDVKRIVNNDGMAKTIFEKSKSSIGRKMNVDEKKAVLGFAQLMVNLSTMISSLEQYIKIASERMLPNTTYLTDEKIAAELLSKAGSLERLAMMPASTVQLLGAEKALFKHIKFGGKPPKYGVLFKMPIVNGAPRDRRGKIARVYATKICIALKADYFTHKFIGKELKGQLDAIVEKIKNAPATEKKFEERPQQERRGPPQQRQQRRGPPQGKFGNKYNKFHRDGGRPQRR